MFPTLSSVSNLFQDEEEAIRYLIDHNVFCNVTKCQICQGNVSRRKKKWRCNKKSCRKETSILKDSVFSKTRIKINEALLIAYLWLSKCSHSSIMLITGHSNSTVTNYLHDLRQLVGCVSDNISQKIGGEGIVVEIDESKFGKRKYHRGHKVGGVWVLGGVECTPERKIFVVPVENRSKATLFGIIQEHVLPGSIIHTDLWKGYQGIDEVIKGTHLTVNHSKTFKDSKTGVHTNTIEGTWNGIKVNIKPKNRTANEIGDHIMEFIWRRCNSDDLWGGLIKQMSDVYFE